MAAQDPLVLAVVTSPLGLLLVHRLEQIPPVMLPGTLVGPREQPRPAAERAVLDDTRLRVRAGRRLGREHHDDGRRPTVYVVARPIDPVDDDDAVAMSLHVGWYVLDQVDMLLPDLWEPVRRYLLDTIPRRWVPRS